MKFLLDANIPYSAKEIFPERHAVWHVRDFDLASASDNDILSRAKKEKAILVTRDLDFANILNFPLSSHCGIIVMRVPHFYSASEIKRVLRAFILAAHEEQLKNSLVIVEEGRFRIRK